MHRTTRAPSNPTLTAAALRLLTDHAFLAEFRRDADEATRRLGLSTAEVDALREGDEARLHALGADVIAIRRRLDGRPRGIARLGRVAPGLAAALLSLSVFAAPAASARRMLPRAVWRNRPSARRDSHVTRRRALRPRAAARFGARIPLLRNRGVAGSAQLPSAPFDLA